MQKFLPRVKLSAVYGGAPIYKQKQELKSGAHIVMGTPGRVLDMIRQNVLDLSKLNFLILDEADEMLNMGSKMNFWNYGADSRRKATLLFPQPCRRKWHL